MDLENICQQVCIIAKQAGKRSIEQLMASKDYEQLPAVITSAGEYITAELSNLYPPIPIVCKTDKEHQWSADNKYLWLVDPLYGLPEFVKRYGDYTINIALVCDGKPVLGVVYAPVIEEIYWAYHGGGAWGQHTDPIKLQARKFSLDEIGTPIVISPSHYTSYTTAYVASFTEPQILSRGSSLDLLLIATGDAVVYPRTTDTMEWETAAADIIVREAGGSVLQMGLEKPLVYNKKGYKNMYFLAKGAES